VTPSDARVRGRGTTTVPSNRMWSTYLEDVEGTMQSPTTFIQSSAADRHLLVVQSVSILALPSS
jgi:hypothetical protein